MTSPPATLLDGLVLRFPRIPRAVWQRRMAEGWVRDAAGNHLDETTPYTPHLRVAYFREVDDEPVPTTDIEIVYQDDQLVVADKPPFLPVTPGGRFVRNCLLYRLEEQLRVEGLSPIHRLDRATSGLVMLSRNPQVRSTYGGLFANGTMERLYLAEAAVAERPRQTRWRLASRIVAGEPFFRMAEVDGPANAVTHISLQSWKAGRGRFLLRPETGKTHQLRLHLMRLGWPILGDRLYPELLPKVDDESSLEPLALVAKRLAFRDPSDGRPRVFESRREP